MQQTCQLALRWPPELQGSRLCPPLTGPRTRLSTRDGSYGLRRLDTPLMEGDSVKAKISYFHHWIDSPGMAHIESWKNNKTLISQEDYEKLDETQKEGKYSLGEIESYFTLFELLLAPKSNPLLAVEELHFVNLS